MSSLVTAQIIAVLKVAECPARCQLVRVIFSTVLRPLATQAANRRKADRVSHSGESPNLRTSPVRFRHQGKALYW